MTRDEILREFLKWLVNSYTKDLNWILQMTAESCGLDSGEDVLKIIKHQKLAPC